MPFPENAQAYLRGEGVIGVLGQPFGGGGDFLQNGKGHRLVREQELFMLGRVSAEEVKAGRLVKMCMLWEEAPEVVAQAVTGGELSEIAEAGVLESVILSLSSPS